MKKLAFFVALFVFGLGFSADAQIVWVKDYQQGIKAARETGKPMLIDFTASWCGPCQRMEKVFWTRKDVIELSKQFVCVKIDADKNADLKKQYGVKGIPYVSITDSWGEEFDSQFGYGKDSDAAIIGKLNFVPKDFSEIKDAKVLLETNGDNLVALAKIAEFYQQKKLFYRSNATYERILNLETNQAQRENLMIIIGFNYLRVSPDEARLAFEKFQKEFPKSPHVEMAIYGQLLAFERQNKFQDAQKMFDRLKADFPKSSLLIQAEQILPQKTEGKK
jgi:thiol-disulfide isomerase/thioredoxin